MSAQPAVIAIEATIHSARGSGRRRFPIRSMLGLGFGTRGNSPWQTRGSTVLAATAAT